MRHFVGERFGRLVIVRMVSGVDWECACDCGVVRSYFASNLTQGMTRSCGCLRREASSARRTTHGGSRTPEYLVWENMWRRCTEPSNKQFKNYGARGIGVCARWESFAAFAVDMGERPSSAHSIERKDNDNVYSPENCVWATARTQGRNRRNNRVITVGLRTQTLTDWSTETGIPVTTIWNRLARGLPPEVAVSRSIG